MKSHPLDPSPEVGRRLRAAARRLRMQDFDTFCRNQRLRIMSQLGLNTPRSTSDTIRRDGNIENRGIAAHYQGEKRHGQA